MKVRGLALWMTSVGCMFLGSMTAQVNEEDSLILVTFYQELNGPEWIDHSGWLEGPVAGWYGVTVNEGRVTGIQLQSNNLTGEIPESVGQLSELAILSIAINNISGELPAQLGGLANLEELVISKNELTGAIPPAVAQLSKLRILNVLSNQLIGPVPDLSQLQSLEEIWLDNNDFSGPFPDWILDLGELRRLGFGNAGLEGELPPELFSSLPNLQLLRIHTNRLEGDVAKWFKGMINLESLDLYNNNFSGAIPDGVLQGEIRTWSIARNSITGIPDFNMDTLEKSYFLVEMNKLDFSQLSRAKDVRVFNPDNLKLGPQKKLLSPDTVVLIAGDDLTIESGSHGDGDIYTWYKDSEIIPGAVNRDFQISAADQGDAGVYSCVISNPDFEFDLQREEVIVDIEETTATHDPEHLGVIVYPNPAADRIFVKGVEVVRLEVMDQFGHVLLSDTGNRIDVVVLPPGTYFLRADTSAGSTVISFIKS